MNTDPILQKDIKTPETSGRAGRDHVKRLQHITDDNSKMLYSQKSRRTSYKMKVSKIITYKLQSSA